jgi:putative hydrolase of the HAD superfamily
VRNFALQIAEHPMQLIKDVPETLAYLAPRHELILLTKGDQEEQQLKIDSSGLQDYFRHVLIVPEKDVQTYLRLVSELELDPGQAWMIGNSPRSDINPALQAGLNAVFIPHEHTWGLEKQDVQHMGEGKLLSLNTFAELRNHF